MERIYNPRLHGDYVELRDLHEEQPEQSVNQDEKQVQEEPAAQEEPSVENDSTIEPEQAELEETVELDAAQTTNTAPVRPEEHYGQTRYVQGDGDYVSETTAALRNDQTVNADYYSAMAANQADNLETKRDAVEQDIVNAQTAEGTVERDPEVSKLAEAYAEAHPECGASQDELYNAAYFGKSVDDSESFPPRDDEEARQVEERKAYEEISGNLREASGETQELSAEEQQEQEQEMMFDRMQSHMGQQQQVSMM